MRYFAPLARSTGFINLALAIVLALGFALPVFAQTSAEAGRILLALGDTKLIRKGQTTPLLKGATLQSGDTITTGVNSNLQLRLSDGAVMALRAQTEFKIDDYSFNGKADGTEKASLNLVQGGVRAVTGVIGRENRDNLKVNTVAATIGVRGTGFNIVSCEGSCFNADKGLAKDGLYAAVFEGKVVVKNEASEGTYGVHDPIYIASQTSPINRLSEPPPFLRDPLVSQIIVPKKSGSSVQPINQPVNAPKEDADKASEKASSSLVKVGPVTIYQTPTFLFNFPSKIYNVQMTDGTLLPTGTYTNYLQIAQVWPGTNDGTGLPYNSIVPTKINPINFTPPAAGGFAVTYSSAGFVNYASLNPAVYNAQDVNGNTLVGVPLAYTQGAAQALEAGTYQTVSWGRWGNGTVSQIAGYNNGQAVYVPIDSGFHYIVGNATTTLPTNTINFVIQGASTPTAINGGQSWFVTSGNLTANFGAATINGNLGLFSTASGNANYNMAFSGGLTGATNNVVSTSVTNTTASAGICTSGCSGSGNVTFYNNPTNVAGLAYNFNTGVTLVQGVAVFKK